MRIICDAPDRIDTAVACLEKAALIANDVETLPFKKSNKQANRHNYALLVAAYASQAGEFVFPLANSKNPAHGTPFHIERILTAIRHINSLPIPVVGHNFSYDVQWYLRYGLPIRDWRFDTMVMFWARYPELPKRLDFVASILLDDYRFWKAGRKNESWLGFLDYAAEDVRTTLRICQRMLPWLIEDEAIRRNFAHGMLRCYTGTRMNALGMRVDPNAMQDISTALHADADSALQKLRYLVADESFNPNSAPQKKQLLYNILGLKPVNARGRPCKISDASTGQMPMRLAKQAGVIERRVVSAIEKALTPAKQISNVVNMPMLPARNGDRFVTFFDGVGTMTTRFASRASAFGHGSNAQNIRKKYRRFMKADPKHFFLDIDFSGADAVYIGFESEDTALKQVFKDNLDFHANTAALLFKQWSYEQVVAGKKADDPAIVHPITGIRQVAKRVSHGAHYLMMGYTLLMTATVPTIQAAAKSEGHKADGWTLKQLAEYCDVLDDRYREGFPRLRRSGSSSWYGEIATRLNTVRAIDTIYGFHLPLMGDPKDEATLRVAAATYGQANTAGRTNAAMMELFEGVRTREFRDGPAPDIDDITRRVTYHEHGILPVLQVHDSIVLMCDAFHPNLAEGLDHVYRVMRRPFYCKGDTFALGIEGEIHRNWGVRLASADTAEDVLAWIQQQEKDFFD